MAVRFDADGEDFTRALSVGSLTAVSVACWAKISVDRDAFSTVWSLDVGATSDVVCLQTSSDGVTMGLQTEAGSTTLRLLTANVWYYLGLSVDASGIILVSRAASETAFTVNTGSPAANYGAVAPTTFRIGESPWGAEWLNGCVTGLRWWNAKLSQAELETEWLRHMPHRTVNLQGWYPLLSSGDTADFSGNGLTLSGGTGASTEDGPPVPWSSRRITVYTPSTVAPVAFIDDASATDALTADADTPSADSGTAVDALTVSASTDLADAAVADEQITVTVSVDLADSASADDTALVGIPIDFADSATADDVWTTIPTPVFDEPATADDQIAVAASTTWADSATATDALTVAQTLPKDLADTATAGDALTVVVLQDITVTVGTPHRGWGSRQPESSWSADSPGRGWSVRPPTT